MPPADGNSNSCCCLVNQGKSWPVSCGQHLTHRRRGLPVTAAAALMLRVAVLTGAPGPGESPLGISEEAHILSYWLYQQSCAHSVTALSCPHERAEAQGS
jgi:hypothetical protein